MSSETTPVPTRLPRATYASMVTERLRDSIVNGSLAQGSQLSEAELATRFGVSRGPVREALKGLIQEGLVRAEPHRGVFVPVLTDADVRDIYLARETLESAAIRHIISTSKSAQAADELDRFVERMQDAVTVGDWEAVSRSDLEFHTALVAATGSPRLQGMFSRVVTETRLCLGVLTAAEARGNLVDVHRQIAVMIRESKTAEALALSHKHFEDAIVTFASRNNRTMEDTK
jgi:DNA-binding GntR family transcriptional regulator